MPRLFYPLVVIYTNKKALCVVFGRKKQQKFIYYKGIKP